MAAEQPTTTPPTEPIPTPDTRSVAARITLGPPFGPAFFATVLQDRVRTACDSNPQAVPVVELHLADGTTLDLCHIPGIEIQWLAAQVYRDRETCEDMDLVFIPYPSITRVTLSLWHPNQRPIGFNRSRE